MSEIVTGDWRIVRGEGVWYRGRLAITAPSHADVFHAVAKAGGKFVPAVELAKAAYCPCISTVSTMVCQARRRLDKLGLPNPIGWARGPSGGYSWTGGAA